MSMLKMQNEMAAASEVIQERIDHIRSLAWGNLTHGVNATTYDFILADATDGNVTKTASGILNNSPNSAGALKSAVETITVSPYPPDASAPPSFTVTNQGGTVTVTPAGGSDLSDQAMVRVDTQLQWQEARSGRTRMQATSFIVAQEGVGK